MGKIKAQHKKVVLKQVLGNDLMTWREKYVMGQVGGLYCLSDDAAYIKNSSDKASMTITEFQRYLNENIDPDYKNWIVVFNPTVTADHNIEGHSIYFYVNAWDAYIPVCKVGRSADNIIPANSQGRVVSFKGQSYKNSGLEDESPVLYRGWVAAFEACRLAYQEWQKNGIDQRSAISPREAKAIKESYTLIGFGDDVKKFESKVGQAQALETTVKEVEEELKVEPVKPEVPIKEIIGEV